MSSHKRNQSDAHNQPPMIKLHAVADIIKASPNISDECDLSSLTESQREAFANAMGVISFRIAALITKLATHFGSQHNLVLQDVLKSRAVHQDKQFIELGLWYFMTKQTQTLLKKADSLRKEAIGEEELRARELRDKYVDASTDVFLNELKAISESSYDGAKIGLLVNAMESGLDLFDQTEKEIALFTFDSIKED